MDQVLLPISDAAQVDGGEPEPAEAADVRSNAEHATERVRLTESDRLVSLGFLAGGIAHQINNALTPMRLSLGRLTSFELSRRPLTEERLHRVELLQDAREGVARIERVLRELKAFSHTDDDCPRSPLDVSALLEIAVGLAGHEIRHRARLVCDYGPIPPVRAKLAELRQVFLNLLINAAHAIPEGQAHLNEIRVITCTDDQGRAVIEISDTGTGIPPDVIVKIFEPFFTTGGTGLGLGLAVSRDVIASLDGEITIDSIVGKGTSVRVALPASDEIVVHDASNASVSDPIEPSERRRILIIDDDRPVAAAIALELDVHDVVVAASGREALGILRRDKNFDVILCDLMMPEVSGIDVYESLRLVDPNLLGRVVLMTGGAFTARAGQFLSEVDVPVIEKPFHSSQLHAVVNALDHRRELAHSQDVPKQSRRPCEPLRSGG